jgi:hypothetical protein
MSLVKRRWNHDTIPLSGHRRSVAIGARRIWLLLLLIAGGAIAPPASWGEITYNIANYPTVQNGYTISGTMTTDGGTGLITNSDVLTWDISVTSSGSPLFALTPSDSDFSGIFLATPTTITSPVVSVPFFIANNGSRITWDSESSIYSASYPPDGLLWDGRWTTASIVATSSAVPEPSAIVLLAMGALGAGGFTAYQSRHRVTQMS